MKVLWFGFAGKNHSWSIVGQNICRILKEKGHKVHIFSTNGDQHFPEDLEENLIGFKYENEKVFIVYNDQIFILKNLHVHSKIIKRLTSNNGLNYIFDRTREKNKIIISLNFYSYLNLIIRIFHRIKLKVKFLKKNTNRSSM
jgi:hypothetical protein